MSDEDDRSRSGEGGESGFPDICDGLDGEEILSLTADTSGELPKELGETSSQLVSLLKSLRETPPTEAELGRELVVIGAMKEAVAAAGGVSSVTPTPGVHANSSILVHLKKVSSRSLAAAVATVFLMGGAAAAATGSLPRGVQNVVAKAVKAVSGVQIPDPVINPVKDKKEHTPAEASNSMGVPAIPSTATTYQTTTTSTTLASTTRPTVAHPAGTTSETEVNRGDSGSSDNGSPIPALPESPASSDGQDNSTSSSAPTTVSTQDSTSTTAPGEGSGDGGSSATTSTVTISGDSGGSGSSDH
jgi:hypothetical protein